MDLKQEQEGSVLRWTIARPTCRNALGDQLALELDSALHQLETQWQKFLHSSGKNQAPVQVLSIAAQTVSGSAPIWIAGGDLSELAAKNARQGRAYAAKYTRICRRLEELPLPVLMKIHGAVIGGGVEFALCGDLRFATEESYLDLRQLQIGLTTGYGGAKRLVESLGKSRASHVLLTSQRISAHQAYEWGLIHGLARDCAELDSMVEAQISKICALEPLSIAAQKKMLTYASHGLTRPALELKLFEKIWKNATHRRVLEKFR